MEKEIRPIHKKMEELIRELLGPVGSDQDVLFCEASIINQCVNPMVVEETSRGKTETRIGPPKIKDIEAYVDHVVKFSLAGIRAIRENVESKAFIQQG